MNDHVTLVILDFTMLILPLSPPKDSCQYAESTMARFKAIFKSVVYSTGKVDLFVVVFSILYLLFLGLGLIFH